MWSTGMFAIFKTSIFVFLSIHDVLIILSIGAIQVLRNADGGGGSNFPEKSVTKV